MLTLAYAVRDEKGRLIKASAEVRTKEELIRSLQAKGLTVISVEEKKETAIPARAKKKLHKKARIDDLIIFARHMAVLLESGVPILRAINVLSQQVESQVLQNVCKTMEADLKAGSSLKEAIAKHPKIFSQMWVDLIETGEATGQLAVVLRKLADYFEEMWQLRKKVISALIYPAILVLVAIAAIFIFMYKIIPVFASIYKGIAKLPFLTMLVIKFSDALSKNIFGLILILVVLSFAFTKYIKTPGGRRQFDAFKLKFPIAGALFLSVAIERFTTSLSMMLKGGVSIVHALEVAIMSTGNRALEEALEKVRVSVIQGKTISLPMSEMNVFPPLVTQMISVGEESGKLAQLLDEISKFYAEDISTKITRLMALFEPAILVVMGLIIGILVVAMYLPIFTLVTLAGGTGG